MTMTAEAPAEDSSVEAVRARPGESPVLATRTGLVAVQVFPGLPGQARDARRWGRALAAHLGLPDPDDTALVVGELFANAVLHTRSGQLGGKVTVAVTADGTVHVHDYGIDGPCSGLVRGPAADGGHRDDFGRGLEIVAALSGGLVHLPAAWCQVAGPDDPAAVAGGCCTCCRPGPTVQDQEMETGSLSWQGARAMVAVPQQEAEEAGLRCRVLVDSGVWDDCVTWTGQDSARKGIDLDEGARLADVLYPAACELQRDSAQGTGTGRPGALPFTVDRVPRIGPGREAHKVTLTVTAARSPRGTVTVTIAPADRRQEGNR